MPQVLPERVLPAGLRTHHALNKLIAGMERVQKEFTWTWRVVLGRAASARARDTNLLPWSAVCAALGQALALLLAGGVAGRAEWAWQGALLLLLLGLNVAMNVTEHYLREVELRERVGHVIRRLKQVRSLVHWEPSSYPHLHTPWSASVVLQWTLRDNKQVNLPWPLLVEHDLVLLKPGQSAPGACHSVDRPDLKLCSGDVLHIRTHTDGEISATPEFKSPAQPQLFVMDKTPYLEVLQSVLAKRQEGDARPPSILYKYAHLFFTRILVHYLLPGFFLVAFLLNLLKGRSSAGVESGQFGPSAPAHLLYLIEPCAVTLPLISLAFPFCWLLVNYGALAWLLGVYSTSRHVKITDDPFDDTVEEPNAVKRRDVSCARMRNYFRTAVMGRGEYLSRTENLVHTLGSITALCCTDKKGILSWPNSSPEKIFLLKREEKAAKPTTATSENVGDGGVADDAPTDENEARPDNGDDKKRPEFTLCPEILTITHDHHNPFKVEFDDPAWSGYMNYLKPLGLAILLNTCNVSTEEKYTNFFNHLVCESVRAETETTSSSSAKKSSSSSSSVDMLPIVTRGCLCELARKIGFSARTNLCYALSSQIQTFRHVHAGAGTLNDRFARNLSLARLKFPFPHMVSVMVQQRATGSRQLISQGTADVVLDSCTDGWTGTDLEPLTEDMRKKILDFYQRASLSSYCTAFAYRPQTYPLPWRNCREYLQLPTHSNPFYWHYNERSECFDADAAATVNSHHVSLGAKAMDENDEMADSDAAFDARRRREDDYVKTKDDAMACLELECNQTFLGMIQLQYQAVVEIVQLIDLLEKACIRFVHFSKENELRSRVFSEKMGLESGWNCHISLKSAEPSAGEAEATRTVTVVDDERRRQQQKHQKLVNGAGKRAGWYNQSRKAGRTGMKKKGRMGASMPDRLNRPAWYLDFPKWRETKGGWNNGAGEAYVQQQKQRQQQQQSSVAGLESKESSPFLEEVEEVSPSSAHASTSVTSESDPFDYDMSNRAQLPRGIENIRPHLEAMDNVPLLVSLFTDCTPNTTKEMLKIMQEYGEVVCVMGSSANYRNVEVFLQADASLAIEPRYPQLCQTVPVYTPPKAGGPSPVAVSQLLNSVASSLSFKMEDEISLFHLILESRHFTLCLVNALKFWMCALISVSTLQLLSLALALPLFLTTGQTLWLVLLFVPALSLALLGAKTDPNVMNVSTGKSVIVLNADIVKYAMWCYGTRFVPAIAFLVLGHLLSVLHLAALTASCGPEAAAPDYFGPANLTSVSDDASLVDVVANSTSVSDGDECASPATPPSLNAARLMNLVATFAYLWFASLSFVSRSHQLWQRYPGRHNPAWLAILVASAVVLAAFVAASLALDETLTSDAFPPTQVWVLWLLGLLIVVMINEVVKRQEIKVEVRHQKRERLEFGTKLGINSPF